MENDALEASAPRLGTPLEDFARQAQDVANAQLAAIWRLRENQNGAAPLVWDAFTITGRCR